MAFPDSINANSVILLAIGCITAWNAFQAEKIKKTGEATHILSNSAMGEQKKLNVDFAKANAVLAHRIAVLTREEGDIDAATDADVRVKIQEDLYKAHLVQQAKVDAKDSR
jgi:hypothetical protein